MQFKNAIGNSIAFELQLQLECNWKIANSGCNSRNNHHEKK